MVSLDELLQSYTNSGYEIVQIEHVALNKYVVVIKDSAGTITQKMIIVSKHVDETTGEIVENAVEVQ